MHIIVLIITLWFDNNLMILIYIYDKKNCNLVCLYKIIIISVQKLSSGATLYTNIYEGKTWFFCIEQNDKYDNRKYSQV